jgi:outer membrane protein TolC
MFARERTAPRLSKSRRKAPQPPANTTGGKQREVSSPITGQSEVIAERRVKALDLRKAGATYRQIAKQCEVSVETAWGDVQAELRALRTLAQADAEELRELELRRLDDWTLSLTPRVREGDPRAAVALVRMQERRAKYTGIDAPERREVTQVPHVTHVEEATADELQQVRDIMQRWAARAAAKKDAA